MDGKCTVHRDQGETNKKIERDSGITGKKLIILNLA